MDTKLQQILPSLQKLKQPIMSPTANTIYFICGNQKAGKNTLVHYLMESELIFEIDQQGQDVLTISNEAVKQVIIDGLLQVIPCVDRQTLYIKIAGFPSQSKTLQENQQWSIAFDYIIKLFSMKQEAIIKFVLIFSLQQLQEDDDIFVKYYNCFKFVPDFVSRTHFVLSKLVDEDQYHQFGQRTAQSIKQQKQNCEYIEQIIKAERVYGFYSRDIDQQERHQFIQNLYGTEVSNKIQLNEQSALTHKTMHESGSDLHILHQKFFNQLKICLQITNFFYIEVLFKGCKIQNKQNTKIFKQSLEKLYGNNSSCQLSNFINQKKNFEKFVKNYAEFIDISKQTPQLLPQIFMNKINYLQENYSENMKKHNFIARSEILILIIKALSQKNTKQFLYQQEIYNVFINHQNGAFEDHFLSKVFEKTKEYFTPEFIKTYEKLASSSPKKKIKKIRPKNSIPNYDEQKKVFLLKPKTLNQILQMVISPLKIDLLLQELQKKRKNKTRNIKDQKIIIKQIIKLLDVYGCFEQAIRFCLVLPDIFGLSQYITKYCENFKQQKDIGVSQSELIKNICKFFQIINRFQYIQKILENLRTIRDKQSRISKPELKKLIQSIENIQLTQQSSVNQSINQTTVSAISATPVQRKQILTYFMNYDSVNQIITKKQTLIDKCINFEVQNPNIIQLQLTKQWIMQSGQLKVL